MPIKTSVRHYREITYNRNIPNEQNIEYVQKTLTWIHLFHIQGVGGGIMGNYNCGQNLKGNPFGF